MMKFNNKYFLIVLFLFASIYIAKAQSAPNCKSSIQSPNGANAFCTGSSLLMWYGDTSSGKKLYQWYTGSYPKLKVISNATKPQHTTTTGDTFYIRVIDTANAKWDTGFCYKIVTANLQPNSNFTFTPTTGCGRTNVQFTSTNQTGCIYTWTFGDINFNQSSLVNPSHTYIPSGTGSSGNYSIVLIIKNANSTCFDTTTKSITIGSGSDATLNVTGTGVAAISSTSGVGVGYKICSSVSSAIFNFNNQSSTKPTNTNYQIIWGDGSPDYTSTTFAAAIPHAYNVGLYTAKFIVSGTNGCVNTVNYSIFLGTNPAVGLGSPGNTDICTPAVLTFPIDTLTANKNPPGTTYTVHFNDGSLDTTFDQPPPSFVTHIFKTQSCGTTGIIGKPNSFYAQITASNPCNTTDAYVSNITVTEKPQISFTVTPKDTVCVNNAVTFTSTSSITLLPYSGSTCSSGNLIWDIIPATGWTISSGYSQGSDMGSNTAIDWTTGTQNIEITFTIPGTYTIKLRGGGNTCVYDSAVKTICVNPTPTSSFSLTKSTICLGDTATAISTASTPLCGKTTYQWTTSYAAISGCTPATSNVSYTIGSDTAANPQFRFDNPGTYTISLVTGIKGTNCISTSSSQTITVKGKPNISINSVSNICQGQNITPTTTTPTCYVSAATYNWTFAGGTPSTSTSINPGSIKMDSAGSKGITLTATNECGITTANTNVSVIAPPTFTATTNPITVCNGQPFAISLSSSTGGVKYSWTSVANATISGNTNQTTAITTNNINNTLSTTSATNDTVKYNITIVGPSPSNCTGETKQVLVIVQAGATTANAGVDSILCNQTSIKLYANNPTVGTGVWKQISGAATTIVDTTLYNTQVTGLTTGKYKFQWTIKSGGGGCASTSDDVNITVNPTSVGGTLNGSTSVCSNSNNGNVNLTGNTGTVQGWEFSTDNGTTWQTVTPSNTSTSLTYNNLTISTQYRVVVKSGVCPQVYSSIATITVNASVSAANAGADQILCNETNTNLTGNALSAGFSGLWTLINGTGATITKDTLYNTTVTTLVPGNDYTFRWTVSGLPPCASTHDDVTISVRPTITAANAGTDILKCDFGVVNTLQLNANSNPARTYETGAWDFIGAANGATINNANAANAVITFANVGTYQLTWTIRNDATTTDSSCKKSIDTINITVKEFPTAGTINGKNEICKGSNGSTLSLTGNTSSANIQWQVSNDNIVYTDIAAANTSSYNVGILNATTWYKVRVYQTNCNDTISSNIFKIQVDSISKAGIIAPALQEVCTNSGNVNLSMQNNIGSNINWIYNINNAGYNSFIPALSTNNVVVNNTPFIQNITTQVKIIDVKVVVVNGVCPADTSVVATIKVYPNTETAVAGLQQNLCFQSSTILQATTPANGVGTWLQLLGPNTATFSDTANPHSTLSNLIVGSYLLKWKLSGSTNNICQPSFDTVRINNYDTIINKIKSTADTLCSNQALQINSFATVVGGDGNYVYQWQQSFDGINWTNVATNGQQETYSTTATITLYFKRIITSSTCTSTSNIVIVIVQAGLSNNTITANQNTCINTTPNLLNGALPTGGSGVYQYQWQQLNSGVWTNILNETNINYQPPLTTILGDTSFRRIVSSGFCTGDISNTVTISTKPDSKAFYTFTNDKLCTPALIDTNNIKAQDLPYANGTYEWYANGLLIGTGILFPGYTIVNNGDTVYIKLKTISPYGCKSDSFEHKFYTVQTPIVSFTKSIAKGCGPLTVSFSNTTTPLNAPTYKWNFNNGQTSTLQQPSSIVFMDDTSRFRHDTTYIITLTAYTQCDSVTYKDSVTVLPKPKALFQPDTTIGCSIFHFRAFNNSLGTHCTYFWSYGDSTFSTDTIGGYVYHDFKTNKTDTFSVRLKAVNTCGADSGVVKIVVFPNTIVPKLIVDGSSNYGCAPQQIWLVNNTIGANKFTINFGDGSLSYISNKNPDTVYHTYQTGGTFTATMKAENGCTDSTVSLALVFYDKPTANFSTTFNQYCRKDNVQFKNLSDSTLSFEWLFGDGGTSTNLHPTHKYLIAGNYTITLIAKSTNPTGAVCTDTLRQTITIHELPIASFTTNAALQNCQPFYLIGLTYPLKNEFAAWAFFDSYSIDTMMAGNVGTHTFYQDGIYKVRLVMTNIFGCTDTASTSVKVIKTPKAKFTASDSIVCTPGKQITFTNHTTFDPSDVVTYSWYVDGVFKGNVTNFNYNFTASNNITTAVVFQIKLVVVNTYGCRDSAKTTVVIYPKAQPSFAVNALQGCTPFNLQFNNTSQYANIFKWYLDGNLFSNNASPSPINLTTPATTYTIKLVADNSLGCGADSVVKQVSTYTKPVAAFKVPNRSSCTGILTIQFSDLSSVVGANIKQWFWNFGDGYSDTSQNPLHTYTSFGSYTISLWVKDNRGCASDVVYANVINFGKPNAKFLMGDVCLGTTTVPVNLSTPGFGSTAITSYLWDFGDGTILTGIQPTHTYSTQGTYTITLIITSDSSCAADTAHQNIKVFGKPIADFKLSNNCASINTIFTNTSFQGFAQTSIGNSKWTFGDGGFSTNFNALHNYSSVGNYDVTLAVAGNRCPTLIDTVKKTITVVKARDAVIYPRVEGVRGTPILLTALSGGVSYNWQPVTGLSNSNIQNPIANYVIADPSKIYYSIAITDSFGCTVTDKQEVWLFATADVLLPTAFTPNGDGTNDLFKPLYINITKLEYFRVFDRWGKIVFETSDLGKYWDGTLNGVPMPMDTYSWIVSAVNDKSITILRKGNVTLIRD